MKESKINHKNAKKIRTAATYILGLYGLCSGPETSGVKESSRPTSPASDFQRKCTFSMQTSCACKVNLMLDTSDVLCLPGMFACHVHHKSNWDIQTPKQRYARTVMTATNLYAENVSRAILAELETNTYFKSCFSQSQRKQC